MWLWSPDRTMTLEDIAKIGQDFPVEEVPDFRSLEEVTDTSLEAFYTTFKDVNNRTCLKTPVNMWR
jgi:hypothetical protein